MKVELIAFTSVLSKAMTDASGGHWVPEGDIGEAEALVEFAGRQCYQSWNRPNIDTATNETYLKHILEVGHFSVLEHGTVTVRISEVSRSLTHELVRHRHFSFSQVSQRFVSANNGYVIPPLFEGDTDAREVLIDAWAFAREAYERLVEIAEQKVGTDRRKQVREAARCVLPNMTATALAVTGNHRTWREFLEKRGSAAADAEIRRLALKMYDVLCDMEPHIYQDFSIDNHEGTTVLVRKP